MPDRRVRHASLVLALVGFAVLATVVLSRLGWPASDYRSNDFFQFWAGPHALLDGGSPYDPAWWSRIHGREGSHALERPPLPAPGAPAWTSPYPPWTHLALVPLALLPFDLAAPAWLVAQIVAVAAGLAALRGRALLSAPTRDGFLLAGLALAFQPLWLIVAGGNLDGFLFGALACAIAASLAGRPALAGVLLGALALKPHLFLVLVPVYLVAAPERRRTALAFAVTVVALVGGSLALRPDWLGPWLASASALGASTGSNATVWTIDRGLPILRGVAPAVVALATIAAVASWWHRARPLFEPLVGAAVCLSLLVAPHGWSYDHVALLVSVAVILELFAHVISGRRTVGVVLIGVVAGALPWALYAIAFRRGGEEWTALEPLAVLGLLVLADRWARGGSDDLGRHEDEGARVIG